MMQVLLASMVKIGVKPPKDGSQLYEVEDSVSVVKGSRKLAHSDQLRCCLLSLRLQASQSLTCLPLSIASIHSTMKTLAKLLQISA